MTVGNYAKSIIGAVIAGLGAYQVALLDGVVNQSEWISVAVTTLLALGAVFVVKNDTNDNGIPDDLEAKLAELGSSNETLGGVIEELEAEYTKLAKQVKTTAEKTEDKPEDRPVDVPNNGEAEEPVNTDVSIVPPVASSGI